MVKAISFSLFLHYKVIYSTVGDFHINVTLETLLVIKLRYNTTQPIKCSIKLSQVYTAGVFQINVALGTLLFNKLPCFTTQLSNEVSNYVK